MSRCRRINRMALGEARTHGRTFTVLNIILGVGCLLQCFVGATADILDSNVSDVGCILLCVGALMGPVFVVGVFREMHNRQQSDVVYALPMSAGERYVSKLLALVYLHILPVAVWSGIAALTTALADKGYRYNDWFYSTFECFSPDMCGKLFAVLIACMMFLDAISVVCSVCCGRLAEIQYLTYLAVVAISAAPLLLRAQLMEKIGGQVAKPGLGYFLWTFSLLAWDDDASLGMYVKVCLIHCLISVAVMALAFLVYRRRDAGSAGKPIVSRVFFELVLACGLVAYYALLLFQMSLVAAIALAGVVYLVIHIISFRGILSGVRIALWTVKFIATTVAFILLLWVAFATDGFGAIRYVPTRDMTGACIKVDKEWDYYEDARGCIAYAGPLPYTFEMDYRNGDWIQGRIPRREIIDWKMREVVKVFQKFAADRDKDFSAFLNFFADGWETKDGVERNMVCTLRIWFQGADGEDTVMVQDVKMTPMQAENLMWEIRDLRFLNDGFTAVDLSFTVTME